MANSLMLMGAGKSGAVDAAFSATLSITANDSAAAEDGSDAGQFTVTLSEASETNTVIAYSITGTATATTDYTALSGTVTIVAEATTATINVSGIVDDAIVEANETVTVTLDSITSGDSGITIFSSGDVATITITDDDVATVSITANDAAAAEDGSDPGQFTVTQTAVSSTATVIAYTVTGTATATTDYTALSGTVTIAAGATTATIDVSGIVDDAIVEGDETVIVTLDSISSGDAHVTVNGAANVATVTITDDDGSGYDPPAVTSDLIVKLDVADPDSWDSGSPTIWTNTVDDVDTTLINGPTYDDTDDIGSIQFDGSDDYASLTRPSTTANLGNGFTVVLWFNAGDLDASGYTDQGWLLNFGSYTPELGVSSTRCAGSLSGLASYGCGNGSMTWCDQRILTDTWYQEVWRNNDDGSIDAWLNGAKDSTPVTGYSTARPGSNFHFACEGTSGSHPLEVKLAQVLVYNTPLSDAEVTSLWDGDKGRFGLS